MTSECVQGRAHGRSYAMERSGTLVGMDCGRRGQRMLELRSEPGVATEGSTGGRRARAGGTVGDMPTGKKLARRRKLCDVGGRETKRGWMEWTGERSRAQAAGTVGGMQTGKMVGSDSGYDAKGGWRELTAWKRTGDCGGSRTWVPLRRKCRGW